MGLTSYKKKRSFRSTPEPVGGKPSNETLRFVVQKHKASRLHYDFRLEMRGALKSWAVPKGPSLNPEDKRLAMEVEDHPYDYKDFEGNIPKGNYGAGTVIVWDEGTYEPLDTEGGKKAMEKDLMKQWRAGSLKFRLKGKKLKGEFALVKMKSEEDNAWLLIKHKDRYAANEDITLKDKSVVSQKTIEQVAKTANQTMINESPGKKAVKTKVKKQIDPEAHTVPEPKMDVDAILKKAKKVPFPKTVSPMLATLVSEPFDDPDWEYEVKWDGYRAVAFMNGKSTALKSRNDKSFADKFYPVFDAIKQWGIKAVVDGEIVAVTDNGISNFNKLQNWRSEEDGQLLYYVFDLLWYEGKNLMTSSLSERKAVLQTLVPQDGGVIKSGYTITTKGTDFFAAAGKLGLEGIIAKRSDSPYHPGDRSTDWLKIKSQKRQEVVIGGYTRNAGTSKPFSSLLLGVFEGSKFQYAGKVGTGFRDQEQREMLRLFKPLVRKTSPFAETPDYNKPSRFRPTPPHAAATWLRPELVCEIHYTEVTEEGVFRHPAFIALREDKDAKTVVKEKELPIEAVVDQSETANEGIVKAPAKSGRRTLVNPSENTQVRKINGNELKFTNLKKVLWPEEKYTKGDLLNYYWQAAKYILPYLKDRPQSLNRFPNGIKGKSFYQKDMTGKVPAWVEKHPYKAEGERKRKHFMLCNNEAALLYMANLAAIEMNPWSSTVKKPDNPTWCLLDLDPDKGNTFEQVIEVAQAIHDVLEDMHIPSYCKTSGSTGLHVYLPLGANYTYDQSQLFAKWIAVQVDALFDFTSVARMTSQRKGKVYIDFLQNRPSATLAAPYSVRPKPGATVSMPLYWEEVKKGLKTADFTIANALDRMRSEGDIFKPVLGRGVNLKKILAQLAK
ncbi:ATP-dependent DNA ligase [Parapedobacter pyrenivorans]|uniref:DNA ligase (ATP) n=1 Tax=Parapedobacter pyrenivorans TaxID=1305674 RepID=A0A917HVD4_9SPHI|nr:DNA ligase D [Parapedobacter pyrenivorans]GGG90627.1 ATP-dependent DNA ligase [Parapedobacter pyrenivorans]